MGIFKRLLARRVSQQPAASPSSFPTVRWRVVEIGDGMSQIKHADMSPIDAEYSCALSFEFIDGKLAIVKLTTEGCEKQGHARPILSELHRLHPQCSDWYFSTDLTLDGRSFWPHIEPWLRDVLGVTLHYGRLS